MPIKSISIPNIYFNVNGTSQTNSAKSCVMHNASYIIKKTVAWILCYNNIYIYIYIYLTKITVRYFKHVYVSNIKNAPCKYGFRVLSYTTAPPGQHRTPRSHKAISYTTHPQGSILHHIHPVQYRTPHSTSAVSYTAMLLIPDMSSFDAI